MKRDQLNQETLMALVELLESADVITSAEADALRNRRSLDDVQASHRAFREGRGPPAWVRDRLDDGDGGPGNGGGQP